MNIFLIDGQTIQDHLNKLLHCAYEPYKKYLKIYAKLETQRLQMEFESCKLDHGDIIECVQLLNLSVNKIVNNAQAAIDRCMRLTFGCGIVLLIDALKVSNQMVPMMPKVVFLFSSLFFILYSIKVYLKSYMVEYRRVATNLKERNIKTMSENEEWDLFRHFLKIIQIFGEFVLQYEQQIEGSLLKSISSTFLTQANTISQQRTSQDPFHTDHELVAKRLSATLSTVQVEPGVQLNGSYLKSFLLDEHDKSRLNILLGNIGAGMERIECCHSTRPASKSITQFTFFLFSSHRRRL
jgi:hypothetical protein